MPKKVDISKNFSSVETIRIDTDKDINELYEAMVAKFGENNVLIEGEGDVKKLVVTDGEKKMEFSSSMIPESQVATENAEETSTAGFVGSVSEGSVPPATEVEVAPEATELTTTENDLADEQLDKLTDAQAELDEVNASINCSENYLELNKLRARRNELENVIINCSQYLDGCGKQYNFSSNEGHMRYYTENGINFSEDGQVIGFSHCDKDYFFSDETDETIVVVDVNGNPTTLNKSDVLAAMQQQGIDPAAAEVEDAEAEADAMEDAENIQANACGRNFNESQDAANRAEAQRAWIANQELPKFQRGMGRKVNSSEELDAEDEALDAQADAQIARQAVPYGQPIDVDAENPYDVDPQLYYVIGIKDNGTETTDDDEVDVEIGVGFMSEEEATEAANNVEPEEGETIAVIKGSELIDKYDEMFDAISDAEMASDENMSECVCDPETGDCVCVDQPALVAGNATVPVTVSDVNNLALTDLESGDQVVTPFGNIGVITKNVEPEDEMIQVSVPDDGVVVEVPTEDFSRDFSVIVSAKTLVNFSNHIREGLRNFDEGSEVADSENIEDESDVIVPDSEVIEEDANVEKTSSEKTEAEKDAEDAKNADEGAKPATVSEVEAIVEEAIENKKPELITEAATKTVEAIAPALQAQSQGMPQEGTEGGMEGGEMPPEEMPAEGAAPAEGQVPVEGEGGESGSEQVNQSERMVNHSAFFQNSLPEKQVNFSNDYVKGLTGCFRRGRSAM